MTVSEILKLDKPLCTFDLETTELNIAKAKIVSISIFKFMPDGSVEKKYALINPQVPISKESSDVHGITDQMVVNSPTFSQLAKGIRAFMGDSYIGGYNNNFFDNALLQEEFFKCGIDYPNESTVSVDACQIFRKMEKRDLSAALKFYCGEEMENAHNAEADNEAAIKVLVAQVQRYEELRGKSIAEIADFCKTDNRVDWQAKIIRDSDGDYAYNFGKHNGQKIKDNLSYANWMMGSDFPDTLKALLKRIMDEIKSKA